MLIPKPGWSEKSTMITHDLKERKAIIINRCFIALADEDYITARSCYISRCFHAFYWHAAQSIEKYCKAFLLYNNLPAKSNHNINALFKAAKDIDHEKLIIEDSEFTHKYAVQHNNGIYIDFDTFVSIVCNFGDPDSRYGIRGTHIYGPVLLFLDQIIFKIRYAIKKQNFFGKDLRHALEDRYYHLRFASQPDLPPWSIHSELPLEEAATTPGAILVTKEKTSSLQACNYPFFGNDIAEHQLFSGLVFSGDPIRNLIENWPKYDPRPESLESSKNIAQWVLDNIKIPKKDAVRYSEIIKNNGKNAE